MVPRRYHHRDALPLNVNGKFDRRALAAGRGDPAIRTSTGTSGSGM
ncbi:hypothetical protein [Kibdelosporangium phytohabitans]|nr:hypothetical protein [Kibdelosporangium phytohabitans]MBE1469218.1 acyl-CoA synthetase (AMP-forming)/AMP-acid ligase II [Kibdelosporangium phytohabitans]